MVRFRDVGLAYPGATYPGATADPAGGARVLSGLSFALAAGSFHWLLGPSGAGKSSLLRLMHLGLRPTAGEAEVLGLAAGRAGRTALARARRRIGVIFQDLRLLPHLSAFENVALPLRIAGRVGPGVDADAREMLRWVGLEERADALPATLSGGERQRVALARAVVVRPALLLADEPTGALDAAQGRRVLALLRELHRLGTTVVVATHAEALVEAHPAPALRLAAGRLVVT